MRKAAKLTAEHRLATVDLEEGFVEAVLRRLVERLVALPSPLLGPAVPLASANEMS